MSEWPQDQIDTMVILFRGGMSASHIATRLGHGRTRNSVLGKLHRLGELKVKPTEVVERREKFREPKPRHENVVNLAPAVKRAALSEPDVPIFVAPIPVPQPSGKIGVTQLNDRTCRWPIGDPSHEDFCFCGAEPRDGKPYCEYHCRMAYTSAGFNHNLTRSTSERRVLAALR